MTTNGTTDIDALLFTLDPNHGQRPQWDSWETVIHAEECTRYHAALTALVAERDGLKQRVAELESQPPADRDRELRDLCGDPDSDLDGDALVAERDKAINALNESRRMFSETNDENESLRAELAAAKAELAAMRQQRDEARMKVSAIEAMGYEWRWAKSIDENGEQVGAWVARHDAAEADANNAAWRKSDGE